VVTVGGVVARGRRGWVVVGGEFVLVPLPEEVCPRLVVVGVESRLGALLVAEGDEHRVDLRLEGGTFDWRRRDRGWLLLVAYST
jgi:hypothetical protein